MSCSLYLVFEYMEHDLSGLSAIQGVKFTEPQVKCYMKQLLSGHEHFHKNGVLPPELLLGASYYGVSVDLWSAGCILAELLAGKPILPGRTKVEQLHKIFKLCGSPSDEYWKKYRLPNATLFKPQHPYRRCTIKTFKDFPPSSLPLLETLLAIDPKDRGTVTSALNSNEKNEKEDADNKVDEGRCGVISPDNKKTIRPLKLIPEFELNKQMENMKQRLAHLSFDLMSSKEIKERAKDDIF
ncbi:unnamed protein product [Lactuca virosa]|uniref:Protein kinase domain-containing protein n=1 Tax=Lactuca virosa TaxID=75947 RepID=A0AAU9NCZ4_9ASTR|nr:unnamed protein product [Lactuca virosa]